MFVAQAQETGFVDTVSAFRLPSQVQCVESLNGAPLLVSLPLVLAGVVYLAMGWKWHKTLVTLNAVAVGALLGAFLGSASGSPNENVALFGAIAGGVMFGAVALPLMNGAVSVTGILAGGVMGCAAWGYAASCADNPTLADYAWAGGLVGLVALGLLAYANFRLTVMIFTSFQGAVMAVAGAVALLMLHEMTRERVHWAAESNFHLMAAAVAVPAVIGFTLQYAAAKKKIKKKLKSSGD